MNDKARKRLLIVQPNLNPPGGAGGVVAWAIQALKGDYELTVLTWVPIDFESVNRFYGTMLSPNEFRSLSVPLIVRCLFKFDPDSASIQPLACLMRLGKCVRRRYAAVLAFCDEIELGQPIIQYIHFPYLLPKLATVSAMQQAPGIKRWKLLFHYYFRPWRVVSGFDYWRMRENKILVNSDWTGRIVQAGYHAPTTTIYPPVRSQPSQVAWKNRENGFVGIGRLAGEKQWEQVIDILRGVRARGYPVHLHIIGTATGFARDKNYYQRIVKLIEKNSSWVFFEENVSRERLMQIIGEHRYGIHGMVNEHFGMSVAEMTLAGCIVFVPNSGGQTEIVGNEPRLLYDSVENAVENIGKVLEDPETQNELRAQLQSRAAVFSEAHFMRRLCDVVSEHLDNAKSSG